MTLCTQIGGWAAGISLAEVPERIVARARLQTDATLAAAAAGERAAAPFAAVAPEGPLGEVFSGAAASIAHDWDDYLYMGHTGHSAVWASRAFAGADGDRALTAQIAANEVAGRLGAALFIGPHNGQFWASIHCAGGAIGAGVALGLDAERLAHALAIALYQPPFGLWPGFMGPPTKLLTAAEPAVQGARAALLADSGVEGPLDVIEHPRGLLTSFSFVPRPRMLGALGEVWLTDTLAYKPRPGCAYLQGAVEAVLDAGVDAGEVESIDVDAGYLTMAMESLGARGGWSAVGVNFSVARSLAVALTAGRLTHEELEPEWLGSRRTELEALAGRVRLHHDWELTLDTVRGPLDAGASVGDVPLGAWRRVARRLRDLNLDEARLGLGDLRGLASNRAARAQALSLLRRRPSGRGIAGLDTSAMRLPFPCRVRIRTRSGEVVERDGSEPGSCGRPLEEQRRVVEEKCALVGMAPASAAAPA